MDAMDGSCHGRGKQFSEKGEKEGGPLQPKSKKMAQFGLNVSLRVSLKSGLRIT